MKSKKQLVEEYIYDRYEKTDIQNTREELIAKWAFLEGFKKRGELDAEIVDRSNPYPDLSTFKYRDAFRIMESDIKELDTVEAK